MHDNTNKSTNDIINPSSVQKHFSDIDECLIDEDFKPEQTPKNTDNATSVLPPDDVQSMATTFNHTPIFPTPKLSNILGQDGKLTPQEKQQCIDHKLCFYCGRPGHKVKTCLKSLSSARKAKLQAAIVTLSNSDLKDLLEALLNS
ncbi:hypothetical protein K439DRAFT_1611028 [Ramaria rubella]|nr:hypothetical protein K439DRAFT_1611028 [Ramaria rubella]